MIFNANISTINCPVLTDFSFKFSLNFVKFCVNDYLQTRVIMKILKSPPGPQFEEPAPFSLYQIPVMSRKYKHSLFIKCSRIVDRSRHI